MYVGTFKENEKLCKMVLFQHVVVPIHQGILERLGDELVTDIVLKGVELETEDIFFPGHLGGLGIEPLGN